MDMNFDTELDLNVNSGWIQILRINTRVKGQMDTNVYKCLRMFTDGYKYYNRLDTNVDAGWIRMLIQDGYEC